MADVATLGIEALYRERPFSGPVIRHTIAAGATISEIIAAIPDLPSRYVLDGVVCLVPVDDVDLPYNPEWEVPRQNWGRVRPRAGRSSIAIYLPPQRGKSLALVATIAVVLAAAVAGPFVAGFLGFSAATSPLLFATVSAVTSAGISPGGQVSVGALTDAPST